METQINNPSDLVTPRSVGVKYGLISGIILILFFLVLVFSGADAFENKWNWVELVITVVLVILAHKNFKDRGNGFMTYGQGVGISFWIALMTILIKGILVYCYVTFIDASSLDLFYEKQTEQLEARGMEDDQINMALRWTRMLFWPLYIFFGIFFSVLVGVIVSIFTQKKNPEPAF